MNTVVNERIKKEVRWSCKYKQSNKIFVYYFTSLQTTNIKRVTARGFIDTCNSSGLQIFMALFSSSVQTFLIQPWVNLKVYFTFLTTACKVRSLVAVTPWRAVLSVGPTPTVIFSSCVWVNQRWFTIARLHFHTYANRA